MASRRSRISAASKASLPKISASGRKRTVVPEPRTFSLPEIFATFDVALPFAYVCCHVWPSRLTVTVISDESAQTTDEPTPWRPPEWT